MKRLYKSKAISYLTVLALTISMLSGCTHADKIDAEAAAKMQEEFDAFIDQEFVSSMENSWISCHVYLEHPENFGVDRSKIKVELAPVIDDAYFEKACEDVMATKAAFEHFNRDYLTEAQQDIYDVFAYKIDIAEKSTDEKYKYFSFDFSTLSGSYNQIPTLLADLDLRDEQDVKDLVLLVDSVDNYLISSADFMKEQYKQGTLIIDKDTIREYCQGIVDNGEDASSLKMMCKHIDELELSKEAKENYKKEVTEAFNTAYLPAYQYIIDTLDQFDEEKIVHAGVGSLENGSELYEIMFRNASGSVKTMDEVKNMLSSQLDRAFNQLQLSALADYEAYEKYMNGEYGSGFDDYQEMLDYLWEAIKADYPEIPPVDYNIAPLASDLEVGGVLAYYNIPALDHTSKQIIKVNTAADTIGLEDLSTFGTVAHEGLPGHMYQYNYCYDLNLPNWMYTDGDNDGFSEGYATYTQINSVYYLKGLPETIPDIEKSINEVEFMAVALCDIAVNYDGMTVEELSEYLGDLGLNPEIAPDLYRELSTNPAKFISYYVGYAEINELKQKAKDALKDQFSEVEFHKALLAHSSSTFDVVERSINQYIEKTKATTE